MGKMTRTSIFLGLALWGVVMTVIPFDALMILLALMGALSLLGVCVVLMGYVVYRVDQRRFDE